MKLAGLFLLAVLALAQQPAPASVQGTVVRMGDNQPLSKATVELRRAQGTTFQPLVAVTTDDGRFAFRNVPPGEYRVVASRAGYVETEFGQRTIGGPGIRILLTAGQSSNANLAMTPTATISGRVTNRQNEPLANATVVALRAIYQDGRRILGVEQAAIANDLGEYRLFWLPPGTYYVSVTPNRAERPAGFPVPAPISVSPTINAVGGFGSVTSGIRTLFEENPGEAHPPVYYPGTINQEAASAIALRAGEDRRGVDIAAAAIATRQITGIVIDGNTRLPAPYATLALSRYPMIGRSTSYVAVDPSTGVFEITKLIPGTYVLAGSAARMTGHVLVEVANTDVENLAVVTSAGFTVSGHIAVDAAGANVNLSGVRVSTRPDPALPGVDQDMGMQEGADGRPAANGAFQLRNVPGWTYRVNVAPLPRNTYVKSIQLGDADVLNGGFRLTAQPQVPLNIIIGTNPGTVRGQVSPNTPPALAGVTVVLVPDPARRHRTELYRTTTLDASGHFQMETVAPGNYKIFALQDVETGAWQDPLFLPVYEDAATPVAVREGSVAEVSATVQPVR